jgi:hypothetical protein
LGFVQDCKNLGTPQQMIASSKLTTIMLELEATIGKTRRVYVKEAALITI